jgi:hypothetical protein
MRRGGAELAALQDDTFYLQVPYPRKIFIRVRKFVDRARWTVLEGMVDLR